MKYTYVVMIFLLSAFIIVACNESSTSPTHNYTPPDDHTISKSGVLHKSGSTDPVKNCTSCHGADLRGGSAPVSCFECHGQKW